MNQRFETNQSIELATDAIGDLFSTVGLKAASGKIWARLYLSASPLCSDDLTEQLRMSKGAVSMAITELMEVGIIHRGAKQKSRKFYYRAETEMWPLVKRIFKTRAKKQLEAPIIQLKQAYEQLKAELPPATNATDTPPELLQLQHLVDLGDFALLLLDAFMERTRVEIKAAQKWLSVSGKLGGEPLSRLRRKINLTR